MESTTQELKKKHSPRLVGGAEMGSWGREDGRQVGSWWTGADKVVAGGPGGPTFVGS